MKTGRQNKGYDYLSSLLNSFFLKGYKNVWYRILFHLIFWSLICAFNVAIAVFKWSGSVPSKYFIFFFILEIPNIFFFYFLFYAEKIRSSFLRFLIGFAIFYIMTHWVQCFITYIIVNDDDLYKMTPKYLILLYQDAGYFGFWKSNVISFNLYTMVFGVFPVGVKFAKDLYVTSLQKQTLEVESTKAELNYLKDQINPHFIFNVINNAYYYVFKKDRQSGELLLKLADIIRYTIEETGEDLILIEKEITILQNLIAIEKIRVSSHTTITYVEKIEASDFSKVKILPLALVTLLENAFKHGVGINGKNGFVQCVLEVTSDEIDFQIINSVNLKKATGSMGIGLNNLRRRLDLLYKNNYSLTLMRGQSEYVAHLKIRFS